MRLVVATDVTVRGGVDTYVLAYLQTLREHGHDVVLLYERGTTSPIGRLAALRGVESIPFPLYRKWHEQADIESACRSIFATLRPDGVHVVTGSPRSCLALRTQVIASGLPLIITESQVSQDLVLGSSERAEVRSSYEAALAVIFVAEGNRRTMAEAVGIDGVNDVLIPNGVDVDHLARHRRKTFRPQVPARLVAVARLSPEKSLDTLVEAVGRLPCSYVGSLHIHGDGPARGELSEKIEQSGLAGRIHLHGWTGDVVSELSRSDLFVLPSAAEGMPYALLEAMAVGLPIVCSDIPGNSEALAAGSAGCLVPRLDPEALAGGIQDTLLNADRAETRARVALSKVQRDHNRANQMAKTAQLWAGFSSEPEDRRYSAAR